MKTTWCLHGCQTIKMNKYLCTRTSCCKNEYKFPNFFSKELRETRAGGSRWLGVGIMQPFRDKFGTQSISLPQFKKDSPRPSSGWPLRSNPMTLATTFTSVLLWFCVFTSHSKYFTTIRFLLFHFHINDQFDVF